MISLLFYLVAAICFTAALWHVVRRKHVTPVVVTSAALGAALFLLAPASQVVESQLWPSLGRLASNVATMIAAYGVCLLVDALTTSNVDRRAHRVRTRAFPLGVAVLVLVASFFAAGPLREGLGLFGGLYRSHPTLVLYALTYSLYLGYAVFDVGRLAARAVLPARGFLRVGLVLMTFGSVLALAYLAYKVFEVGREVLTGRPAEAFCSGPFSTIPCTLAVGTPALSVLMIIVGFSVPAVGAALAWWHDRRAYRRLRPLWAALVEARPEIAFDPGEKAPAQPPLRFQLYRQVIEIRDGILAVAPDGEVAGDPGGAAEQLHIALRRTRRNPLPAPEPAPSRSRPDDTGQVDFDTEITWLTQLARAFVRQQDASGRPPSTR
ncbi:MAB_1171c family putative transporter [Kibdelosporangium phytohabitans]|uniref:DUF6545 domain-containing protein n=1 Tax=Kibdelosporangium phytohabitans TaxID=860235 RepID=A0A0N9ICB8_9PSEU|nr:MAB_1171c family putative transporter [Kibdelosporangium phytohabitans]ALG12230.1 hypothetical protein AOZ06_40020 [Kibdelosporangium phytohabitans]MBE1463767.1 hypothetical protein [Kibdelosporangium phytohabitans]